MIFLPADIISKSTQQHKEEHTTLSCPICARGVGNFEIYKLHNVHTALEIEFYDIYLSGCANKLITEVKNRLDGEQICLR